MPPKLQNEVGMSYKIIVAQRRRQSSRKPCSFLLFMSFYSHPIIARDLHSTLIIFHVYQVVLNGTVE